MDLTLPLAPGLVHVGYVVRNVETAMKRFVDEGYEVQIEPTPDPIQNVYVAQLDDGITPVELVSPLGEGSPVESRLKRGGGLDHLCFAVDDVAAAVAAEEEKGAMVVCEPVPAVAFDRTVAFMFRKTGLIVEYMSIAPLS